MKIKKIKGSGYLYVVIMGFMLVVIGMALVMPYADSKLLPLVFGACVFALSAIGLWRDLSAKSTRKVKDDEAAVVEKSREGWGGYLTIGAWIAGFFLVIYLLGFLVAIPLFILAYMKSQGVRWLQSITYAVLTTAVMYGVFERFFGVILYRGLLFIWLS